MRNDFEDRKPSRKETLRQVSQGGRARSGRSLNTYDPAWDSHQLLICTTLEKADRQFCEMRKGRFYNAEGLTQDFIVSEC